MGFFVEILCTIYPNNSANPVERITFKMSEATHHEYMERCDSIVYKWAKFHGVNFDDYWFGYRIISREEIKDA